MRIGVVLPPTGDPADVPDTARRAEEQGFDLVASGEQASRDPVQGEWFAVQELNDIGEQPLPVARPQTAGLGDRLRGPGTTRAGEMQGPDPQDPPRGGTGPLASQVGTEGG